MTEHVLTADGVSVEGRYRPMLTATDVELRTGEVRAVVGEPGHGHTALALALAGRLTPDSGTVTLDGAGDDRALQTAVALVDVSGVSEPDPVVPLGAIVGEELAMAGRRVRRATVAEWIDPLPRSTRMEDVPPEERVSLMLRLAALRPAVSFLVLTLPERWGVQPWHWEPVAGELAESGYGVLVTTGDATALHVHVPQSRLGTRDLSATEEGIR